MIVKFVKRSLDSTAKTLLPLRNNLQQLWTLHSPAATQMNKIKILLWRKKTKQMFDGQTE